MNQILELLKQRRVWAGIVSVITFVLTTLNINYTYDVVTLTDLLYAIGQSLSLLIPGLLALWSYLQPKKD